MSESAKSILVDTTVLVDVLRGSAEARGYLLDRAENVCVSVLSEAELFAGSPDPDGVVVGQLLSLFRLLPVTSPIAQLGGTWRRKYRSSHGTSLVDALIAATAAIHDCDLATHNIRHFPMFEGLSRPY